MDLIKQDIPQYHVLVKFGSGIPDTQQGHLLLIMEQWLRDVGIPAEVFLETMRDQNVLRRKLSEADSKELI
jgi:hypothetical protein